MNRRRARMGVGHCTFFGGRLTVPEEPSPGNAYSSSVEGGRRVGDSLLLRLIPMVTDVK